MANMLLLNPRRRRKSAKSAPKRKRARKAHATLRANPAPRRHRRRRSAVRRNPLPALRRVSHKRRHHAKRRRRNPISMPGMSGIMGMLKDAAVGAVGSVAVDAVWAKVNGSLPASLQAATPGLNAGTAVKVALAAVLGKVLSRPTRGLSQKAATGSITVTLATLLRAQVGSSLGLSGVGYAGPAAITRGQQWVQSQNSRRQVNTIGAYPAGNRTPLLSAYPRAGGTDGGSPLLSAVPNVSAGAGMLQTGSGFRL